MREYYCRICDEKHQIKLNSNLIKKNSKYPISYIFLHGNLKNILTTLYLDKELQIRGVDVQKLDDDDIFSKDQVISITNTLMKEIESLREENRKLSEKIIEFNKKKN